MSVLGSAQATLFVLAGSGLQLTPRCGCGVGWDEMQGDAGCCSCPCPCPWEELSQARLGGEQGRRARTLGALPGVGLLQGRVRGLSHRLGARSPCISYTRCMHQCWQPCACTTHKDTHRGWWSPSLWEDAGLGAAEGAVPGRSRAQPSRAMGTPGGSTGVAAVTGDPRADPHVPHSRTSHRQRSAEGVWAMPPTALRLLGSPIPIGALWGRNRTPAAGSSVPWAAGVRTGEGLGCFHHASAPWKVSVNACSARGGPWRGLRLAGPWLSLRRRSPRGAFASGCAAECAAVSCGGGRAAPVLPRPLHTHRRREPGPA